MSLALSIARFGPVPLAAMPVSGLLLNGVLSLGLPYLPRMPQLADFLPRQMLKPSTAKVSIDSRLQELKELLEKNGEPPFMIDNGAILKAVPKKRPSKRRTREKLYAPGHKQMQALENLGRCAACGRVKRSHFMCMHCFAEIRTFLKQKKKELFGETPQPQKDLDPVDEKIVYPGKYVRDYEMKMQKKDWIPKREEPLMFNSKQVKKK